MIAIPASWMRGGTSKGVFFLKSDLPGDPVERDQSLLKVIGSPDPYAKQINGLGGATSSTSKVVIINKSDKADYDVDYLFGHVAIKEPFIDYSGNCGNLTSAVGVFAIEHGLVDHVRSPITPVRVWQENLQQRIIVNVSVDEKGNVITEGNIALAGISGTGAPIVIDFIQPGRSDGTVLPTGQVRESLQVENTGAVEVSLVQAGNATVFVHESTLGLKGNETYEAINSNSVLLDKVEAIRCAASVRMGLASNIEEAKRRPGTPKLACVARARDYVNTQGTLIKQEQMDLRARIFSMGKLHHAYTGTGAIATAVAASIPGNLVSECLQNKLKEKQPLIIGHTAGTLEASAVVKEKEGNWIVEQASLLRTARTLMRGEVLIPEE